MLISANFNALSANSAVTRFFNAICLLCLESRDRYLTPVGYIKKLPNDPILKKFDYNGQNLADHWICGGIEHCAKVDFYGIIAWLLIKKVGMNFH
ncbi:hypothetical protein N476_00055 [Pseudoalteromonas luteoviolacea H33]|uniref:Uncharacterized protein n=1 Tax=Pseudoalteromonas luteoviolacea H33 TaxID=1365251 RepID=A0A167GSE0_9GAMM|nr:hypothetical protein N476_00055 [Pseudoalteromonas luteoviolacea H33]KZN75668.1 hypothetical protein N477_18455 [Pseudoalteromonas luteoviolacea H33-S]